VNDRGGRGDPGGRRRGGGWGESEVMVWCLVAD
jgi:hypothetical protein